MSRSVKTAGACACGWLMWALLWPTWAPAQIRCPANASSTGVGRSNLPSAPSASLSPAQAAEHRSKPAQSWWLAVPENAPYRALSPHEKFQSFVHHTISPYTFAGALYDASWAQLWGDPQAYGGGMEGWGKRLGAAVAGSESRGLFGLFFFPTLLHQDPRYFAMYQGPVAKRGLHALSRVFVTRNDEGKTTFNTSGMLTIAFTESLGMAWTPEGQRSAGRAFTRMLGAMQGDATSYLLREFTPDILLVFKRHAPPRLQRIEEKMPAQITGDGGR